MSNDVSVSRREFLAALTAAGTSGAVVGTGTAALYADEDSFVDNLFGSGTVDLVTEWDVDGGPSGSSEGDATIDIDLTDGNRSGSGTITVRLPDGDASNPAYAWLRARCPPASSLNEALSVTLRYCGKSGTPLVPVNTSLTAMANILRNGVPLDPRCGNHEPGEQRCLQPGEPVELHLEWELDDEFVGRGQTSLTFDFVARQCRYRDGTVNPFDQATACRTPTTDRHGVSFVEIHGYLDTDEQNDCTRLGKLELEDDYCGQSGIGENSIDPGTYDLYEDGGDCGFDSDYDVRVTETVEKNEGGNSETTGLAFELLRDGGAPGPELCKVVVKGGPTEETYEAPDSLDGHRTLGPLMAPEKQVGNQ